MINGILAFYLSGNPQLFYNVLNFVFTANGVVYRNLHAANWHVPEAAMYHLPATSNDLRKWGGGIASRLHQKKYKILKI